MTQAARGPALTSGNGFLTSTVGTAFLFPGQGGYSRGLLPRTARQMDGADSILDTVCAVARDEADVALARYLGDEELELHDLLREAPDALQFGIYAASVASAQALRKAGVTPGVCAGHSFGEIAALAAAGACSVEDGARIVAHRIRALSTVPDREGAMISAAIDRSRADSLLRFLNAADLVIAGQNEEQQIVFSGPSEATGSLERVLHATGITGNHLASPYPFHSPLLAPAVDRFAAALGGIRWAAPTVDVYSPILGRTYRTGDDMAALLASHLVTPFDFLSAVRSLHAGGIRLFVECGGRDVLTSIVKRVLAGEPGWTAVATDTSAAPVEHILRLVTGTDDDFRHRIRSVLNPVPSAAEFDRYWAAEGFTVLAEIQQSYERFRAATPAVAEPAAPAAAPRAALDRERVFAELVDLYGEALEYPAEVFSKEVDLEGELGVDSVKQTDLLGRVARRYALPPAPEGLRLSDYRTLGHVVDLVMRAAGQRVAA
jgi:acyl transferase domain-containing protein